MKKFLVFIIAGLMALSLIACGDSTESTTAAATTAATAEATTEEAAALKLVDGGKSQYKIVYPEGAADSLVEVAQNLADGLTEATGAEFKCSEDMAVGSGTGKKEILLGVTDREESTEAIGKLKYAGEYTVSVTEDKIVFAAMLDECYQTAADQFIADVKAASDYSIDAAYAIAGKADNSLQYLPSCSVGSFQTSYQCGDGAIMLIYNTDTAEDYKTYLTSLESSGFTRYTDNTLDNNYYATYTNEAQQVEVNLMNLGDINSLRITIEPMGYLPATAPENIATVVTPSISMLGLEGYLSSGSPNQIGMSFIFQLGTGHFIIFDGGHGNETAAGNIMAKLQELAPDPNDIVIDAWVLTHAHADHMNAFIKFASMYGSQVTLKLLVYNLPDDSAISSASEYVDNARNKINSALEYFPGCETFKIHMGQVLYLGDAVMTCYGSYEMIAPESLEYFNNSSCLFFIDLAGQRINMMADCGPLESPVLTSIYGDALKSDIVQIDHHGYQGATSELYKLINPDYGFWPSGTTAYEKYKDESYNVWVNNHVRRMWVAADQMYTELLPITY